jgi:FkbM family methyltransferase
MIIKRISKKLLKLNNKVELYKSFEKLSYAQSGEDLIIDYIFKLRNIHLPTYLDLGANHPFNINNTFLFYKRGSIGINIDANPNLIELFNNYRPKDKNINIGIGDNVEKLAFYVMDESSLSTFSEIEASKLKKLGHTIIDKIQIQTKTINNIIEEYNNGIYPDFVTIDVEGFDEQIICSMNLEKSRPKVICLETVEYTIDGTGKKRDALIQNVISKGYTVYADTNINTIFVENNFWFHYKNHQPN